MKIETSAEVAQALAERRPVVALESTIISHGLPRPDNLAAAREFEQILRDRGVTPATVAVLDGVLKAGLTDEIVDMNDIRPYIQAFANACYQNPESICPVHQMLLPRVIRDYDALNAQ